MNQKNSIDGYRTVRIHEAVYKEIENLTREPDALYRSVSEFVHEALRIRLEHVRDSSKKR